MKNYKLKIKKEFLKNNVIKRKPLRNFVPALCTLWLMFCFTSFTIAQSVDSLITEAVKNNPQLKSLQYRITASEKRTESINPLPAPNLSVEFSQVPTNTFDVWNQSNSNNFSLSQMFPLGGKLNAM